MVTKPIPAERSESVFGRQEGSMEILGDIVHTDDVHAEGIQELEQEWDGLYGRESAEASSEPPGQ